MPHHKSALSEPAYSFTIPSLHDDLALDCRIYHPKNVNSILQNYQGTSLKGAILVHPYAPLGGSYDDPVVLSCTETLLGEGYIVGTFNLRGAGDSAGRTSWTSKPEVEDFTAVAGLMVYYLHHLSTAAMEFGSATSEDGKNSRSLHLLLGGYSFGSLILARLPSVLKIISRFEAAERGTAASEIFLRARMLAKQTVEATQARPSTLRGRRLTADGSPTSPTSRASPVTVGGEETDPSERRRSRDTKHSADIIREVPSKIRSHIRKHSGAKHEERPTTASSTMSPAQPVVDVAYLMISPVLVPLSTTLLPPGLSFSGHESGLFPISHPTLLEFGSEDTFTSAKKLRQWAERLAQDSGEHFHWKQIEGAGHFWREEGAMRDLQSTIIGWSGSLEKT